MLSNADYRFLKRSGREFKMSRTEVLDVFVETETEPTEAFVDFQIQFGGYLPDPGLTYGLFYPTGLGMKSTTPTIEVRDNKTFARCDLKNLNQIVYEIDESGQYYEDGHPLAESFANMVAFNRYLDATLTEQDWKHIPNDRLSTKRYQAFFDESALDVVLSVSDKYHQALRNKEMFYIKCGHYEPRLYVSPHVAKRGG